MASMPLNRIKPDGDSRPVTGSFQLFKKFMTVHEYVLRQICPNVNMCAVTIRFTVYGGLAYRSARNWMIASVPCHKVRLPKISDLGLTPFYRSGANLFQEKLFLFYSFPCINAVPIHLP
ncbi:MAG: hypothetical protein WA705_11065, partial [Candidatus Ozemobacteraceae bacterium]